MVKAELREGNRGSSRFGRRLRAGGKGEGACAAGGVERGGLRFA